MDRSRDRRYDLDALRVLAVLLLVPFHSARVFDVFDPVLREEPGDERRALLGRGGVPQPLAHAAAVRARRSGHLAGPGAARGRGVRARAHPAAAGPAALRPPGGGPTPGFLASRFRGEELSVASFLGDYWTVEGDLSGYTGSFTPAHLWFIGFLFIFSLVALPLLVRWRGRRVRTRWLLWAMPLVLLAADELPAPNDGPQNPWYSLALFVAGFLLLADERTERLVHRLWRPLLAAAAITMTTVLLVWSSGTSGRWSDGSPPDIGFSLFEAANTWIWVLALLGAGRALLSSPAPRSRLRQRGLVPLLRAPPDGHRRARLRRRWMGPRSVAEVRDPLPGRVRPDPGAVRARRPPDEPDPLPVRHEADAGRGGADDLSARCRGRRPRPARSRTRRPPAGCGRAGRAW